MHTDGCIVVFGGTGGVGRPILERLLHRQVGPIVATRLMQNPPEIPGLTWVRFDAATGEGRDELIEAVEVLKTPIGAMIFAIGRPSGKRPIVETPPDEWAEVFSGNAISFANAYTALHGPARRGRARVVVLGSDTTRRVGELNGPYTAGKAALEAVALTLAKEEARYGVRVNVLAPSLIDSPLAKTILRLKGVGDTAAYAATQPWGRLLGADEVAEAAVSLALDSAWSYATGQVYRLASGA